MLFRSKALEMAVAAKAVAAMEIVGVMGVVVGTIALVTSREAKVGAGAVGKAAASRRLGPKRRLRSRPRRRRSLPSLERSTGRFVASSRRAN